MRRDARWIGDAHRKDWKRRHPGRPLTDAYARRKRPVGAGGVQISYRQAVAALSRTPLGPTAVDIVTRALKSVVPERQRRRLR